MTAGIAWEKVLTNPLGLAGYALCLVFGVVTLIVKKRGNRHQWIVPAGFTLAAICVLASLALAYHSESMAAANPATFPLTVYVHGEGGPQDIVLRNSGHVVLKLGPEAQSKPILENGEAVFPAIPSDFQGKQVEAWVESDTYESPNPTATIAGTSLDLQVKKKIKYFKLAGTVLDSSGKPLSGVSIAVAEYKAHTETNTDGWYELNIAADQQQEVDLVAQKQGYETKRLSPTLGDSGFNFPLKRSP